MLTKRLGKKSNRVLENKDNFKYPLNSEFARQMLNTETDSYTRIAMGQRAGEILPEYNDISLSFYKDTAFVHEFSLCKEKFLRTDLSPEEIVRTLDSNPVIYSSHNLKNSKERDDMISLVHNWIIYSIILSGRN